ncbi:MULTISPECIES: DUF3304 domain-containing protein [unclassified Brenneria]|uniref:DUF3304 domain-containing protein n=1 Tax=unclassified Brenneria TaxID=2634434 RepID=UPI0029C15AE5|nr:MULTISPECIES: DUF3304 domain-containing protein [unclassified Brenneria]MDX5630485.1 DUF3304 domain-containing protein [Brenneria sp. L3-3Z]MDX5697630.1 DUF3304 domain-containing protein [Brenneria sp. L4-2C]MEE3664367.1 DUF3304 domain-containing protein [Brenneria sp. g21c3]
MKIPLIPLALCSLLLSAAAQAGTLDLINHTHRDINRFSVDGIPGIDSVGPYQGGGGGCCYRAPMRWRPGMTVRVDWETGGGVDNDPFPGFADWDNYLAWEKRLKSRRRQYSKVVPLPRYEEGKTCGITVHFLPCDEVKVTTSCMMYGHPDYPIKEPIRMPEPKSCPK